MSAFLAYTALAIAFLAAIAVAGWIGVRAEEIESRIPYDDGRGPR